MNGRRNVQPGDALSFGPFSLFVAGRLLKRADEMIPLGGRPLDVLIALDRAGWRGRQLRRADFLSVAECYGG